MGIALVLTREVIVIALLMGLGMYMTKRGMFTVDLANRLAKFVIAIVMPVLLINTFQRDKTPALMPSFFGVMVLTAVMFAFSVAVSTLIFRRKDASCDHAVARLAVVLPNCGFIGIPLLLATTGEDSIIYCAAMFGVLQLYLWCWGIPMLNGTKPSLKSVVLNPGVGSFVFGFVLFLLDIRLPTIILSFMEQISALNTPLSMLMTGIFLADLKIRDTFCSAIVYKVVFLRNLLIPLVSIFLIYIFHLTAYFGKTFSLAFVILISCSCAASTLVVPVQAGKDGTRASQMIAASTLFSIVTVPFAAFLAEKIF